MAKKKETQETPEVVKEVKNISLVEYLDDSVELVPVVHTGKHIELCARNAYKSEDKITEDSFKGMLRGLKSKGHGSCFEHGSVYLKVFDSMVDADIATKLGTLKSSKYTNTVTVGHYSYIYTNARVILENVPEWLDSIIDGTFEEKGVSLFTPKDSDPFRRVTFRIRSSRAILDEIMRHRVFGFTCESTRYVDYSGKFAVSNWDAHEVTKEQEDELKAAFEDCARHYYKLKELGAHKDICRLVLALGIKSEVMITGNVCDFLGNFKQLRQHSTADKTVQVIANKIEKLLCQ